MKVLLYVFLGGGLGSVLRFYTSVLTAQLYKTGTFPLATFLVNVLGCLLIGMFSGYFIKADNSLKFLLITGFCGGFTTFSAFSAENLSLWQNGNHAMLIAYILLSVFAGVAAVYAGLQFGKMSF